MSCRPSVEPSQSAVQLTQRGLLPEVKRPERESDKSLLFKFRMRVAVIKLPHILA